MSEKSLFLGFDSSTQGLKVIAIDSSLEVAYESALNFDADLPDYGTEGGAHHQADGLTVTAPAIMWVEALDKLLARMKSDGVDLSRVAAISGSGQQHGSVWLASGAEDRLKALDSGKTLKEQLQGLFAIEDSPIWMDASTTAQCKALEAALGGAQAVADLTGSRAYERFTGNQIAKLFATNRAGYDATERIALVSSFMPSLLAGQYASIDVSDGSGMNLMDIRKKAWSQAALDAMAEGLADKLGTVAYSHEVVGTISPYYVERYGFSSDCALIAWSGDNPCSLAGLRLQKPGDIAISLGTSDTMFGSLSEPRPSGVEGHIFVSPIDPKAYMVMLVHQNGSLARESVRDACADGSWKTYAAMLEQTVPGNGGHVGLYIDEPEITPPIQKTGRFRFDPEGNPVDAFPPEVEVRACYEGQLMSLRLHAKRIGLEPTSILATGGASVDLSLVSIIANVFGVPIFTGEVAASAALGAAYRALHGHACAEKGAFVSFGDALSGATPFKKACEPDPAAHKAYDGMMDAFEAIEDRVAAHSGGRGQRPRLQGML